MAAIRYLDEQNTDFVGSSSRAEFQISGKTTATLPQYQAFSDTGNVYGTGSAVVAA